MLRYALAVAGVAVVLSGCGGDAAPEPAASADATPDVSATATPAAPKGTPVRFRAADGKRVSGLYTSPGPGSPAVVLLHEIRGGPEQWAPLVPSLNEAGFATLAYVSRPSPVEPERMKDALGAVRWLRARPDVDRKRIALVGASIGASTTAYAMASGARGTADAAVALSPPDSADVWRLQDANRWHPHDVLFVSDTREAVSAEGMLEGSVRSRAIRSREPGHGVALLAEPGVRDALLDWLQTRVR